MATSTQADAPPVHELAGEFVATLCVAGLTYLAKDDVDSAVLACDIVGPAFERLSTKLRVEDRASLSQLVTELRMGIVNKRGQQ
jgi:hypothetical protein